MNYKHISGNDLTRMLDKYDTNVCIQWTDTPTMKKLLQLLYSKKYMFICGFYVNLTQSCEDIKKQIYDYFYRFYHGNSKIYLHVFYNDITGKNEIQLTNLSCFRSYPQLKKQPIFLYFGG